jgi:hypothetical protein
VIEDGVTGFICDNVDEMVKATARIGEIDPDACRRHAERFSVKRMCRGYVEVYESLATGGLPGRSPSTYESGQTPTLREVSCSRASGHPAIATP